MSWQVTPLVVDHVSHFEFLEKEEGAGAFLLQVPISTVNRNGIFTRRSFARPR